MTNFTQNMYLMKTLSEVCDQLRLRVDHRLISATIGAHNAIRSSRSSPTPAIRSPELIVTKVLFCREGSKMIGMCLFRASGPTHPALKPVMDSTSFSDTQVIRRQFSTERTFLGSTERSPAIQANAYWFPISLSRMHLTI